MGRIRSFYNHLHTLRPPSQRLFFTPFQSSCVYSKVPPCVEKEMARVAAGEAKASPPTPPPPRQRPLQRLSNLLSPPAADLGVTLTFNLLIILWVKLSPMSRKRRRIRACAERRQVANTERQTKTQLRQAPPPHNVRERRRLPSRELAKLQTNACLSSQVFCKFCEPRELLSKKIGTQRHFLAKEARGGIRSRTARDQRILEDRARGRALPGPRPCGLPKGRP